LRQRGWEYSPTDKWGVPVPSQQNVLLLSAAVVCGLEAANLESTKQGIAFLLAVTIFTKLYIMLER